MKRLTSRTRQRGIALLMTLGVLALLLIMALSFAYTTRTERLAAGVNTDLIKARLLAESGVERAIAFLREQYPGNPAPGKLFFAPTTALSAPPWVFDPAVSPPAPPGRGGRYLGSVSTVKSSLDGVQNHIEAALGSTIRVGSTAYQFTPNSRLHDAVGWVPIKVDHGSGTESCVGLVGYLVINETGKIDPSQAVGDFYGDTSEATSHPDTRLGLDMREIALADLCAENGSWTPPFSFGPTVGDLFYTAMPSPGRWHSMYHITNAFAGMAGFDQGWLNRFTWSLRPFSVEEPEAYPADTAGGTLYHRCDINAIDWNTIDVGTFPLGKVAASLPYDPATVGIPWVGQIMAADAATHTQVVANIIDFLDADVSATTGAPPTDTENDYVAGAAGALGTATYVGLEDVPYANELFVRAAYVERFPSVPLPPMISFETRIDVEADVELINIYDTPRTVGRVDAELTIQVKVGSETQTETVTRTWTGVTVPAHSYVLANSQWGTAPSVVRIAPLFSLAVAPVSGRVFVTVVSTKITLNKDANAPAASTLWDFAQVGTSPVIPFDLALPSREGSADVNDPRCNTAATQWTWNAFANSSGTTHVGAPVTAGARNTHCIAPAGSDVDDADPVNWSTAFIRNGPVASFWELGAIHRGEPWRTLNLHNTSQIDTEIGQYSYGDWPLLNQVKLSSTTSAVRGCINVWDVQPMVWKPLLQGLRLGSTYADPAGTGTEITDNAALAAATLTLPAAAPAWSNAAGALYGRAAVVGYTKLTDGSLSLGAGVPPQDRDARYEELVGKLVGLLNDRISYYTIIVCAMAVQDVGGLPPGITAVTAPTAPATRDWIEYETGRYCRPMAEQKVMALVWRDVATSKFRIASFEYLED